MGVVNYLLLSGIIFVIGLYGVLSRQNAVAILMSVELMLNAANINLVAFSSYSSIVSPVGQIFTLFVIAIAAAEAAVGLAIIILIYRLYHHIKVEDISLMKW